METLMHWMSRLEPLINKERDEEVIVVFANRSGAEDGVSYAGTSAVLGVKGGEVSVYGILGRDDRNLLVVDTENEPYGKLVYRPEASNMHVETSQPCNNAVVSPSKTFAPPPPPPPPPLLDPRPRFETPTSTSGESSTSEVLHSNDTGGTAPSTASSRSQGQPKLTLRTSPEQLQPPIPIPPADSRILRWIDSCARPPARHPMDINPPPARIRGGEVVILTEGPKMSPRDSLYFSESEASPVQVESTLGGLSSAKSPSILGPLQHLDSHNGPSKLVESLERLAFQEEQPLTSPPHRPSMTHPGPKAQRVEELSRNNPSRRGSPICHEAPRGETRSNTVGSDPMCFRGESRSGGRRGRSTGPHLPAIQPASRSTTPENKNRGQRRGRSKTLGHQEASQTTRLPSRRQGRSTSARPIGFSQFHVIEEQSCEAREIRGARSRSVVHDQIPRRPSASPSALNRSASVMHHRTMCDAPVMSNLKTHNVEKTPSQLRKFTTQPSAEVLDSDLIPATRSSSPVKQDERSLSPPPVVPASPAGPHHSLGRPAIRFVQAPRKKSRIELWLANLVAPDQMDPAVSCLSSPITPTTGPATPRAMVTPYESWGPEHSTVSFVGPLESMINAPEFVRAW